MKSQKPAEGILKRHSWGDSMWYHVECECTSEDHSHEVSVEATDNDISVSIYVTSYTSYNDSWWDRLRQKFSVTWDIWFNGCVKTNHELLLREQAALNYAETIKQAVKDVKEFKKNGNRDTAAS